jgi:hypothetical protein
MNVRPFFDVNVCFIITNVQRGRLRYSPISLLPWSRAKILFCNDLERYGHQMDMRPTFLPSSVEGLAAAGTPGCRPELTA